MSRKQTYEWLLEEDEVLWNAMKEYEHLTTDQLSTLLPQRKPANSRRRIRLLKHHDGPVSCSSVRPHVWSEKDDQELLRLVADETNTWKFIAQLMGSKVTEEGCQSRFRRLKTINPQLHKSGGYNPLRWKKRQFSEKQIEQYRKLLDSQTLIGKHKEPRSAEEVAKMQEYRANGKSYLDIGTEHGLSTSGVYYHCTKSLQPGRHRWTVKELFDLWSAHMIDGLSFRKISDRFGWPLKNCESQVKAMRNRGLWLKEDGTLTECTFAKKRVSCERDDREQLADNTQRYGEDGDPPHDEGKHQLGDKDEQPMSDNTGRSGDEKDRSACNGTQLNTNNQKEQNLRARNCTKPDQDISTHFQSERDTVSLKDEVGNDVVGSLGRIRNQYSSGSSNASLDTQAHCATKGFIIKHESLENGKAVETEMKYMNNFSNRERITFHRTELGTEAYAQLERLDFENIQSTPIKLETMVSHHEEEECPGSQTDDLKGPMTRLKGELESSLTKEVLNCPKKRVSEDDEPEHKLENIKKRRLFGASSNPFTIKVAANGQIPDVQPQEVWLKASLCHGTLGDHSRLHGSVAFLTDLL